MTAHKKRIKKMMQSVGIQRSQFQNQLKDMREYDEFNFIDIINWCKCKQELHQARDIDNVDFFNS